jgi:carbonic anhydrase
MKKGLFALTAILFFLNSCNKSSSGSNNNSGNNNNNNNNGSDSSGTGPKNANTIAFYTGLEGQSPINIVSAQAVDYQDVSNSNLAVAPFSAYVVDEPIHYLADSNNIPDSADHFEYRLFVGADTIPNPSNYVILENTNYYFQYFFFYHPGLHQIDGQGGVMELVMSFNSTAVFPRFVYLSVMIQLGASNPIFQQILDQSPKDTLSAPGSLVQFNLKSLFPSDPWNYFTYSGSVAEPALGKFAVTPYYGPVAWFVYASPITISQQQFNQYTAIYTSPHTRAVQPLAGRTVYRNTSH